MGKKRSNKAYVSTLVIVLWMMIFFMGCTPVKRLTQNATERTPQPSMTSKANDLTISGMVERITPSVVGISTTSITDNPDLDTTEQLVEGVGTGVIVDAKGYILTNEHVAGSNTKKLVVILSDGRQISGTTLWADRTLDLAVVKIEAGNLTAASLGDGSQIRPGDPAIAIGTPLGLQFQHTVTSGIISALNRTLQIPAEGGSNFMEDLIQTDASINPGNSGGPLLNSKGEVIGINTIKVEAAEGIGFAISIDVAKPIVRHFIEDGTFKTPYIGIFAYDKEIAGFYEKIVNIQEGVYVINVDESGPAYQAGIRVKDVITRIDNKVINTMLDLRKIIYAKKVGQSIRVHINRSGKEMEVTMSLKEKPVK